MFPECVFSSWQPRVEESGGWCGGGGVVSGPGGTAAGSRGQGKVNETEKPVVSGEGTATVLLLCVL